MKETMPLPITAASPSNAKGASLPQGGYAKVDTKDKNLVRPDNAILRPLWGLAAASLCVYLSFYAISTSMTATTSSPPAASAPGAVLVTGATGRTGSLLYRELKRRGVADVRVVVRDVDKARSVLGCDACDASEGVYVGDLADPDVLEAAAADGKVVALAVAAGASPEDAPEVQRRVEFDGVRQGVRALGLARAPDARGDLRVVLCSSMGTDVTPQPSWSGDILFWKLNAEAFVSAAGIPSTVIVKPCGLPENMAGQNSTLMVGHDGTFSDYEDYHMISREDLAAVMAEAVLMPREEGGESLRFDLCSRPGPATTDLRGLIESSRWEWNV